MFWGFITCRCSRICLMREISVRVFPLPSRTTASPWFARSYRCVVPALGTHPTSSPEAPKGPAPPAPSGIPYRSSSPSAERSKTTCSAAPRSRLKVASRCDCARLDSAAFSIASRFAVSLKSPEMVFPVVAAYAAASRAFPLAGCRIMFCMFAAWFVPSRRSARRRR